MNHANRLNKGAPFYSSWMTPFKFNLQKTSSVLKSSTILTAAVWASTEPPPPRDRTFRLFPSPNLLESGCDEISELLPRQVSVCLWKFGVGLRNSDLFTNSTRSDNKVFLPEVDPANCDVAVVEDGRVVSGDRPKIQEVDL